MIEEKNFYFITDKYFVDFPDKGLMKNHEMINGKSHNRPCFLAIKDKKFDDIYWMIPISSKVDKYTNIFNHKMKKFKSCDTIHFGLVLGEKRAFLLQNMCPVIERYIEQQYFVSNKAVTIDKNLEKSLIEKSQRVLSLNNKLRIIFPDVKKIKHKLINQLKQEKEYQKNRSSNKKVYYKQKLNFSNDNHNKHELTR